MKYVVSLNGKNYEVEVEKGEATITKTTQAPVIETTVVQEAQPAKAAPQSAPAQTQTVDGELVKSPMPGTILDIKVNSGDSVKKGDILIILEAMKMENEVTAPQDGVVAQIIVAKGASVATGDGLVVLK
jgi:biotin carboxyl carrier protein